MSVPAVTLALNLLGFSISSACVCIRGTSLIKIDANPLERPSIGPSLNIS